MSEWEKTIIPITDELYILGYKEAVRELVIEQAKTSYKAGEKVGEDRGYENGRVAGYNQAKQEDAKSLLETCRVAGRLGMQEVADWGCKKWQIGLTQVGLITIFVQIGGKNLRRSMG